MYVNMTKIAIDENKKFNLPFIQHVNLILQYVNTWKT